MESLEAGIPNTKNIGAGLEVSKNLSIQDKSRKEISNNEKLIGKGGLENFKEGNGPKDTTDKLVTLLKRLRNPTEDFDKENKNPAEKTSETITLTKDEYDKSIIRGNPSIIALPDDKAKEFGVDKRGYQFKEPVKEEVERYIDGLCKEHPSLEPECLKEAYGDLRTKLQQEYASNGFYKDKVAKFLFSKLNLEEVPVWVEGKGYCEVSKKDGKITLRGIEGYALEDKGEGEVSIPAHVALTPHVLEAEIFPVVSSVTGIGYEKILKDMKKINILSSSYMVKKEYGLTYMSGYAICGYRSFSPHLDSGHALGTAVHEITHLEDLKPRTGVGILDFFLSSCLTPDRYDDGAANLAESNGIKNLANIRKDIALQTIGDLDKVNMVGTWIAEYLDKVKLDKKNIINIFEVMGLNKSFMKRLFGDECVDYKIDAKRLKGIARHEARAYEIAKYFGEDVQVLKISGKEWGEFSNARKDWRNLFRHPLKADILDYEFCNLGDEPGLGLSSEEWLDFLKKKKQMLKAENKLLKSMNPLQINQRRKMEKTLEEKGISVGERLKAINEDVLEVDEKVEKIKKGDWKGIKFEDLVWRIRKPKKAEKN